MSIEDNTQLIEDYLNNQLSPEAKRAFEQRMQREPDLAQEVTLHRNMLTGIRYAGRQELKDRFRTLERTVASSAEAPVVPLTSAEKAAAPSGSGARQTAERNLFVWVSGIAATLLIVVAGAYFWWQAQHSDEQLYASYYKPYENILTSTERSETAPVQTRETIAMQAYDKKDYAQAAGLLQGLLNGNPENPAWRLYLGICYLETDQTSQAIEVFRQLVSRQNHLFVEDANWYLSLAYLKAGQREDAVKTLWEIVNSDGIHQEEAGNLLEELE